MTKDSATLTGQCHCGSIAYEVHGEVVKSSYCDCRGCQRATATLKAPFVTVLANAFTLKTGQLRRFQSMSTAQCDVHGAWHFCPTCGTHIYWKGHEGDQLDIFAGTLDDTSVFQPKA